MKDNASAWTFLTNHGHVLLSIANDKEQRIRDIADVVGITERAVIRILSELEAGGYITRTRHGRRTRYVVQKALHLRHPVEAHSRIADLLRLGQRQ